MICFFKSFNKEIDHTSNKTPLAVKSSPSIPEVSSVASLEMFSIRPTVVPRGTKVFFPNIHQIHGY